LLWLTPVRSQAQFPSPNIRPITYIPVNAPLTSSLLTSNETFAADARAEYDDSRTGPLSSPTGDFLAFLPLSTVTNSSTKIHASALNQSSAVYLPSGTPKEVKKGYHHQMKVLNNKLLSDESAILELIWADGGIVLGLQQPFSRGSIETISANVFDGINADAGFLRNPLDVAVLTEGVRFARKLADTSAIKELEPVEILPGRNVTSDHDLEKFIRSTAGTLYHPAGSCKLGAREMGGVVDQSLRVYGVKGLRVVDASVIPLLPASHLMTTVYAIAEKVRLCGTRIHLGHC
jgi:choline dehydrogenase-like flavoprotein